MGVSVPAGGEHWSSMPGWLDAQTRQNYQRWIESYADQYGVPAQALYNMARQETNWDASVVSTAGARGLTQWMPDTIADARTRWGWADFDPANNPQHAIEGSARFLSEIYQQYYGDRADGNWRPVFAGYNWGQNRDYLNNRERLDSWNAAAESALPVEPRNYVDALSRGLPTPGSPPHNLDIEYPWATPEENAAFGAARAAVPGINSTGSSVEDRLRQGPSGTIGQDPIWNQPGIISPEYGHYLQTIGLMPANLLPSGGTDFTNTTWTAAPGAQPGWWGPWGSEAVHNWAQEGVSHGYGDPIMSMLGNLNYNLVDPGLPPGSPPLGGTPSTTIGPTTGLPNVATGGVDLAHWIANQWGSSWGNIGADRPSNVYNAGNFFPADMPLPWDPRSPRAENWTGHEDLRFWQPFSTSSNVYDASNQPAGQSPPNNSVLNWLPASGGWGEAGPGGVTAQQGWAEINASGNPNNWVYNPATLNWGTFGGGTGNQVEDYNRWYDDIFSGARPQPAGGFNPVGNVQPSWGEDLAQMYGMQSGGPGYGAAQNPIFGGMYYSQMPSAQQIAAQNANYYQIAVPQPIYSPDTNQGLWGNQPLYNTFNPWGTNMAPGG